jgi:2-oxoglutarate ferredoxin oxidoreductase subunit delta
LSSMPLVNCVDGNFRGSSKVVRNDMLKPVVISINENLCKGADGCGICLALCPKDVFKIAERLTVRGIRLPVVERITACTKCDNCVIYCPDMAIVVRLEEVPEAATAVQQAIQGQ